MKKRKLTKHVLGSIGSLVSDYEHDNGTIVKGIVFSNKGAKGRVPLLDVSKNQTGDIYMYQNIDNPYYVDISAPTPGYDIKASASLRHAFSGRTYHEPRKPEPKYEYADVKHLDVSGTSDFAFCFAAFGNSKDSKIVGLESWDMSKAKYVINMFYQAFPLNEKVTLDVSSWKVENVENTKEMFKDFAREAKYVQLYGIEKWTPEKLFSAFRMFKGFAPESNCQLDLSGWSNYIQKNRVLADEFSENTFFRIKEPSWEN